eukprot:988851-Prorocentrum_minimum.AAC.1
MGVLGYAGPGPIDPGGGSQIDGREAAKHVDRRKATVLKSIRTDPPYKTVVSVKKKRFPNELELQLENSKPTV